ncbi:hypothetical protein PC129_g16317 [Phytophthora cactorum]|nr:hypothetical protein Pcac1_g27415 [Phytophthora cactorum]KAG2806696.1 hypothetical protein PC112_g17742 [Phytophthora cactorum]KAG2810884.1 hypothetical protein PC111_g15461 [Phytophthora cactorum]KAG2886452.1 hypothetical protein PC114_g19246 [Phytophthora cactorum]KAG2947675.1 hypothetical protein PC117_g6623 [Phytophthora cactorum]
MGVPRTAGAVGVPTTTTATEEKPASTPATADAVATAATEAEANSTSTAAVAVPVTAGTVATFVPSGEAAALASKAFSMAQATFDDVVTMDWQNQRCQYS